MDKIKEVIKEEYKKLEKRYMFLYNWQHNSCTDDETIEYIKTEITIVIESQLLLTSILQKLGISPDEITLEVFREAINEKETN